MRTIKLEDGTEIKISESSYKAFEKVTKKDWRDAFIEKYDELEKVKYNGANCLKIPHHNSCTKYRKVMEYGLLFINGGFWFDENGLHFVMHGYDSNTDATYQHAKEFLENE